MIDLADEEILFFEPASEASVKAAEASHRRIAHRSGDQDAPLTREQFIPFLKAVSAGWGISVDPRYLRGTDKRFNQETPQRSEIPQKRPELKR
ncbi:hypothetical protein [Silvibacterium acidisoli]|uniref:hypothetical protein n=1 Tax=Acidobacteriaceae bacterium ZG23-2 TaxID=2883246 RepID=UPI00406BE585